jgi:transposase
MREVQSHLRCPNTKLGRLKQQRLSVLPQKRNAVKGKRTQENRAAEKQIAVDGPQGDTEWEKAISLINFGFPRPNGSDLSRFKSVLFSAKAKNVPITAKPPPSSAAKA